MVRQMWSRAIDGVPEAGSSSAPGSSESIDEEMGALSMRSSRRSNTEPCALSARFSSIEEPAGGNRGGGFNCFETVGTGAPMVEFQFTHSVGQLDIARVERWICSPPRGPIAGAWAHTPLSDRRELAWGMATQLADLSALHPTRGDHLAVITYVSERMNSEHPTAWARFLETHDTHERASIDRKLYRLRGILNGIVVSSVKTWDST